ncbi:MAG: ammonium transporter [Cohaesibacteraceae bacterium]
MRIGQKLWVAFGAGTAIIFPAAAAAAETVTTNILEAAMDSMRQAQHSQAEFTWLLTCAGLVLMMQIGFLMLEAGSSRAKNSINVAQKNLCDFLISVSAFAVFGFSFMFGASQLGIIGWDKQHLISGFQDEWTYAFFTFQAMFVGTATTIVSGAISERMKMKAYAFIALMIGVIIYPVYGHWAWGNLLVPTNNAWLADLGFIDFAGSMVVPATGAWVALVAVWMIGPRRDKYDADGNPRTIHGHSMVLATSGAIILFVGWIGFNGGSTPAASEALGHVIINTILAGTFGGAGAMLIGKMRDGNFQPHRSMNGLLAGLVAATAGADAMAPLGASLVGVTAGIMVVFALDFIERRLKLDDVVGAIAVHGVAGVYGTLAVALLALDTKLMADTRLEQLGVQAIGVGVHFVWVISIAVPCLWLIDRFIGLRVTDAEEEAGLNVAEHGASLGTHALQEKLKAIAEGRADLATRLDETTGDDAADLAMVLNPFLAKVQGLMGEVSGTSGHLAAELSSVAGSVSASALTIDARTADVETAAQTVASSTQTASTDIRDLRQKSTELASSAGAVSSDIRQIAAFVENLDKAVSAVAQNAGCARGISDQAVNLSQTASDTVSQLSAAADEIEEVVDLIIGIQSQTNLLALNATIEAARAGEHGKGFSVVAHEIKALSDRTAGATEDIRNAILKVRDTSIGSRDMITEVGSILQSVADAVATIQSTAEEEHGNVSTIVRGVEDAAVQVSDLSEGVMSMEGQTKTVEQTINHAAAHAQASQKAAEDLRNEAAQGLEAGRKAAEASHEMEAIAVGMTFRAGGSLK